MNDYFEKKKLHVFTQQYPFGNAENFIESEILVMCHKFQEVYIYPLLSTAELNQRSLPANAEIRILDKSKFKLSVSDQFLIIRLILTEFFNCRKMFTFLKTLRVRRSELKQAIILSKQIESSRDDIYYSCWMNNWCLSLSILKLKRKIFAYSFRCGGFDIWDERWPGGYMPFQALNYKYARYICPNSKVAENYLKQKNIYPNKIVCQYLGTKDLGESNFKKENCFTIVSCAGLIPLKRIRMLIEALAVCQFEYKWIHFGDGQLKDELNDLASKKLPALSFIFKGKTPNSEILRFYKENSINVFIGTSETEGLPVSMQEAISFGIPVISTDVGGVREVVTSNTGILIDKNSTPQELSKVLSSFINSNLNTVEFRKGVRNYWKNNFEAESVYSQFADFISLQELKFK